MEKSSLPTTSEDATHDNPGLDLPESMEKGGEKVCLAFLLAI